MIFPKLTQGQLETLARAAEACVVHPHNLNPSFDTQSSYNDVVKAMNDMVTPQVLLSLIQTVANPNAPRTFDVDHSLTP